VAVGTLRWGATIGGIVNRVRHRSFGTVVGAVCAGLVLVVLARPAEAQSAPPSTQSAPPTTKPAAPKATQPEGPGAPTITSVTAGNEKAHVTWKASTKKGAPPATKYEVTPYRGKAAQPPVTVDAPATTVTVTGLANKAKYTFRVTAIDAQGTKSKESLPSNVVTPKAPGTTWYKSKRYWAAGLLVLAAIVAGAVFFFRRSKKTAPAAPSTEPSMPQEA
jgi:hypothetical protein